MLVCSIIYVYYVTSASVLLLMVVCFLSVLFLFLRFVFHIPFFLHAFFKSFVSIRSCEYLHLFFLLSISILVLLVENCIHPRDTYLSFSVLFSTLHKKRNFFRKSNHVSKNQKKSRKRKTKQWQTKVESYSS